MSQNTQSKKQIARIVLWHKLHMLFAGIALIIELPAYPFWWVADKCKWKSHDAQWGKESWGKESRDDVS